MLASGGVLPYALRATAYLNEMHYLGVKNPRLYQLI